MSYISLSDNDKKRMLEKLGLSSIEDLFCCIPDNVKLKRELDLPKSLTEPELLDFFQELTRQNTHSQYTSFLGGGAYSHIIPSIVDYLSQRGEFISPYTPYQPEVSQGTLQIIFEFQTLICQLTGLDVANASLYDGASGCAEAILMANRLKLKPKVIVARSVHPQYKDVIRTYSQNLDIIIEECGFADSGRIDMDELEKKLDEDVCALVVQSPNFLGVIEDLTRISGLTRSRGILFIVSVAEPVSLGLLEAPGHAGADIVVGEGQSFGIPVSFGGPYLGFMSCRQEFIRHFPGRIAGRTVDVDGRTGFVLTLSTREQHIRRERATSNICTNQALCALRATIFLEMLGKDGLRELAWQNIQKANYALGVLTSLKGVEREFSGPIFNEFCLTFPRPWREISNHLKNRGFIAGLGLEDFFPELSRSALICVTEKHTKKEIDSLAANIDEILQEGKKATNLDYS